MGYTFRIPYICRTSVSPGQSAGRVISSRKNYDAGLRPFQLLRLCLSTTNFNLSAAIPFLSTTNSILSTTFPFLSAANRFLSARRQVSTSLPARTRIAPASFSRSISSISSSIKKDRRLFPAVFPAIFRSGFRFCGDLQYPF